MRCYSEQEWYGKNFLSSYLEEKNLKGKTILEIGCAEAGFCYPMETLSFRISDKIL